MFCHLDLPWPPTGLEQRVGRAARPGAARAHAQTYTPYIRRGGIEHVVSVLAARGGEHHQILDSFEGVHAAESTVATQLGEITGRCRQQGRGRGLLYDHSGDREPLPLPAGDVRAALVDRSVETAGDRGHELARLSDLESVPQLGVAGAWNAIRPTVRIRAALHGSHQPGPGT